MMGLIISNLEIKSVTGSMTWTTLSTNHTRLHESEDLSNLTHIESLRYGHITN